MRYEQFSVDRILDILQLGTAMHAEGDYSSVPFDNELAAQYIFDRVIKDGSGFGVIAYDGDKPVGLIAGGVANFFFSPATYAYDHVWYVLPEYRGSRTALRLLKMFESWSKAQGCVSLCMGVSTGIASEKTGRMFERLGFRHVGGNYRMDLNVGA